MTYLIKSAAIAGYFKRWATYWIPIIINAVSIMRLLLWLRLWFSTTSRNIVRPITDFQIRIENCPWSAVLWSPVTIRALKNENWSVFDRCWLRGVVELFLELLLAISEYALPFGPNPETNASLRNVPIIRGIPKNAAKLFLPEFRFTAAKNLIISQYFWKNP